jgi:hypothetical protein
MDEMVTGSAGFDHPDSPWVMLRRAVDWLR